jgi:hypothetical protein
MLKQVQHDESWRSMALTVSGWKLPRDGERERLLDFFPP